MIDDEVAFTPGVDKDPERQKTWTLTLNRMVLLAAAFAVSTILAVGTYGIITTNRTAATNTEETITLGKCVFQFQAYRALYTQTLPTTGKNAAGLDPLGGLKPPKLESINLDRCQKYLEPITREEALGITHKTVDTSLLPPLGLVLKEFRG